MDSLGQDLKQALRSFLKTPGFTTIAVLTLALGIGASTALFSAVHAVLLEALPYPGAERLYALPQNQSVLDLLDVRAAVRSFEAIGAATTYPLDVTGKGEPVQVSAGLVDRGFFEALAVQPALGRTLTAEEDTVGGPRAAVVTHGFFTRFLGGDAAAVGAPISLSGDVYTVVGVLPRSFRMPGGEADLLASVRAVLPAAAQARGAHMMRPLLRLRPEATVAQAQAELDAAARLLAVKDSTESRGRDLKLVPLREELTGAVRPALLVLFGAEAFLLLIASANFANLLLVRAVARRKELSVRRALGAGRGRLARQLLTESVLLSLAGGLAGVAIARPCLQLLLALRPDELPALFEMRLSLPVLGYALLVSIATGVVFGLAPVLGLGRLAGDDALAEGARGGTAGRGRTRLNALLVTGELALALILLVGAGLLVRTYARLSGARPGFDGEGVLTMRLELPATRYESVEKQDALRRRLFEELARTPGLQTGAVSELPLSGASLNHNLIVEGAPAVQPGDEPEVMSRSVDGDYLGVMRIPILRGRGFASGDRHGAPLVALVNETMARQHFAGQDPVGRRVRWARLKDPVWITIVGVVGDVRHFGLGASDQAALYTPFAQSLQSWKRWMWIALRGPQGEESLIRTVKAALAGIDPLLPVTRVKTMRRVTAESLGRQRFSLTLLGLFAALALVLSAIGIYGVMSHAVAQRTREFGIRVALGAESRDVRSLVLRDGFRISAAGLLLGIGGALALTRLLASLLFGVSPTDPLTYASITALLGSVALAACSVPALRATRVDPATVLRQE